MAKISIPKRELKRLYYKEKKSKYKIGEIYNCSFKTVLNRMREFGMKPLSRSIIQSKYKKKKFSGNNPEKAYIIGFRLGDLNIYKTNNNSEVIVARCHTTQKDQLDLIKNVFKKYGQVTISKNSKNSSYQINCFLNDSFEFLLKKGTDVEKWITDDKNCSKSFAAGYVDAEGNIGVYDKRARFKIDSYDKEIIFWFYEWFLKNRIKCPDPIKIGRSGQVYEKRLGYKYNKDLWRIRVSEKNSLENLLILIDPYLKHKKRKSDLKKCLKNLDDRKK